MRAGPARNAGSMLGMVEKEGALWSGKGCSGAKGLNPWAPLPASPQQPCDPEELVTLLHLVSKASSSSAEP